MSTLRAGPPLDKSSTSAPSWRECSWTGSSDLMDQGSREGATCWQPQIELPSNHYLPTPARATSRPDPSTRDVRPVEAGADWSNNTSVLDRRDAS